MSTLCNVSPGPALSTYCRIIIILLICPLPYTRQYVPLLICQSSHIDQLPYPSHATTLYFIKVATVVVRHGQVQWGNSFFGQAKSGLFVFSTLRFVAFDWILLCLESPYWPSHRLPPQVPTQWHLRGVVSLPNPWPCLFRFLVGLRAAV